MSGGPVQAGTRVELSQDAARETSQRGVFSLSDAVRVGFDEHASAPRRSGGARVTRLDAMATTLDSPQIEQASSSRTALAPQWKVILHNDDVTTFEFVIELLVTLFKKSPQEALKLTYEVHEHGSALAAVTSFERAELYVEQVFSLARGRGFPLVATLEQA